MSETSTICYKCNVAGDAIMSQTMAPGITTCPTGWSTTIPKNCDGSSGSEAAPSTGGCDATFTQYCSSNGSVDVEISIGSGLKNVQLQNGTANSQLSTCAAVMPNPFTVNASQGDTITISAYCGDPVIQADWNKNQDGGDAPSPWANEECGDTAVSSTTKIVCFYDTTSLGAGAQSSMYAAANQWIKDIQATQGYTGEVYHIAIGGERWVLWPAWLLDSTVDIDGINRPSFASTCGANTPSSNWAAAEAILPAWASDGNSYVQTTGSQGATKAMPAQVAAGEDVLVIIFADEVADQPNGYIVNNTGPAQGSTNPNAGGYHLRSTADNTATIITHAQSIYDVTIPECIDATASSNGWNLWEWDYNTAVPKISAHNAGAGNIRTYIYPSQPTTGSIGDMRRSFPFHVWCAVNSGDGATGLLAHGTTVPTCQIADLRQVVQTSPSSYTNWYVANNVGRLDQHGFGANVECKAFTSQDFADDLNAFLSLNQSQCTGKDCAALLVVKPDGTPVAGENVTIGSTSLITNASGYTSLVTDLSGSVSINGCYNHTFAGDCTQYLFKVVKKETSFTVDLQCILGCTDPTAINYNPQANVDDGSCEYCTWGCTDPLALNYNPLANCDDGSCQLVPPIVECVLINMAKEILKECHTECGEPEKLTQLEHDFRELEAVLAQIYMLIDCGKTDELRALFPMVERLMNKYQCDSCFEYSDPSGGDPTQTQDETSATTCGATVSGPCKNILLSPKPDALQIESKLTGGTWTFQSTTADTILGDISGKSLDVTTYCGPLNIDQNLLACGMESIPNDTNIYCFYDVTSTCVDDIVHIVNAVESWFQSKVIADPSYTGDVYHLPVHGEKWLRCGEYPIDQQFHSGSTRLVNGPGTCLGGGNKGYSTTLTVSVLDRSTIGSTNSMVTRNLYGPKGGTAVFNDIATSGTGGAIPYLRPGGSYSDQGTASGGNPDSKAVVLCFFDEAEGNQGGGPYHERVGADSWGYPPVGDISDFGNAPLNKWKTDYNSFIAKHPSYSFFKGFLYPVIPGINVGADQCGIDTNGAGWNGNPAVPHTGKLSFVLASLAGIHKGVWDTTTDGPVPVNPVVSATSHPGTGQMGTLSAITLAANPFVAQGYDGLSEYGWSMDPTVGTPGTNLISGVFTSGQFNNTLDSLLSGGATCNQTDCLTVIVKDADTGAVINDIYTQTAVTVAPGTHQILDPQSNVTVQTDGNCSEYIVTVFKDVMDKYTDCLITTEIQCGCGGSGGSIVIGGGVNNQINGIVTATGETSYGTITNETLGITDELIFEPDHPGGFVGSITLNNMLKNSSFFDVPEIPDGRYKITLWDFDGELKEFCFLILCDSYSKLLDAYERYTLAIECCPKCTAPYDAYEKCYTLYRVLKVTGIDCGLEPWIDKAIINLQKLCNACAATAKCDETC